MTQQLFVLTAIRERDEHKIDELPRFTTQGKSAVRTADINGDANVAC
jgi:hypothetical protein